MKGVTLGWVRGRVGGGKKLPVLSHHNAVRIHDRVKPVSDGQHSTRPELLPNLVLNEGVSPASRKQSKQHRQNVAGQRYKETTLDRSTRHLSS